MIDNPLHVPAQVSETRIIIELQSQKTIEAGDHQFHPLHVAGQGSDTRIIK